MLNNSYQSIYEGAGTTPETKEGRCSHFISGTFLDFHVTFQLFHSIRKTKEKDKRFLIHSLERRRRCSSRTAGHGAYLERSRGGSSKGRYNVHSGWRYIIGRGWGRTDIKEGSRIFCKVRRPPLNAVKRCPASASAWPEVSGRWLSQSRISRAGGASGRGGTSAHNYCTDNKRRSLGGTSPAAAN